MREVTAELEPGGGMVSLAIKRGGAGVDWRGRFPVEHLAGEIAFYKALADRRGGMVRDVYQPVIAALEAVQKEV